MYSLSREEARQAMIDGKRVKHYNFTRNEYLYMEGSRIMTEDGYFFGDQFDNTDWMESRWMVVESKPAECLMDVIKEHPESFIDTCHGRANTTPSMENRKNHLNLAFLIEKKEWEMAAHIITHPDYRKPLNGVVVCLQTYSSIPRDAYIDANRFEKAGKLV